MHRSSSRQRVQPRLTAAILALTIGPVIVVAASGQPATAAAARFDRASVSSLGGQANNSSHGPAVSGDGRYVAFQSDASNLVPDDTNDVGDIFVHDRDSGQTTRVSVDGAGTQANSSSNFPAISASNVRPPSTSGRPRSGTATGSRGAAGPTTGCLTRTGSVRSTGPAGTGKGAAGTPRPPPTGGRSDSGST